MSGINSIPRHSDEIKFGKFKGKPHSILKEFPSYCKWLTEKTNAHFAIDTKRYLNQRLTQRTCSEVMHHKTMFDYLIQTKSNKF